jgi:intraflagellar transport protein 172
LEEIWERAIEIALNYVPNRHVEIALEVSRRLVELNKEESAADILFEIGRHEDAINICITGKIIYLLLKIYFFLILIPRRKI